MATGPDFLLAALAASPDGLTRPELLGRLREQVPYLQPNDVERMIEKAGDAVRDADGRLFVAPANTEAAEEVDAVVPMRRFVVFDLESIVRPIVREPYKEQHVFQIGAVRFGIDTEWVAERPQFCEFTALRKIEDEQLIYSDDLRARYETNKRPAADVLEEFRAFCDGADVVIAYNGVGHDFPTPKSRLTRHHFPSRDGIWCRVTRHRLRRGDPGVTSITSPAA